MELHQKHCQACKGKISVLKDEPLLKLYHELKDGWVLEKEHHIEKKYVFKNFKEALAFTSVVGCIAEAEGHHPEILLSWGKVILKIWTHKVDGLTESDFILAAKCDKAYMSS